MSKNLMRRSLHFHDQDKKSKFDTNVIGFKKNIMSNELVHAQIVL